ncbi:MAG: RNA polymerase sigma factor [Thermoguttaceae bacterium]|nr:RNA polymerase sigma factor [Planctomycetaceae bacterium]MBQ4144432.1 RNA polymerase sigma factor [Thermoguttaceae bacterium]
MNPNPSDLTLVEASQSGDTASFGELVRRYQTRIQRYFMLVHSVENAQDLTQETFLRAWRSLGTYRSDWNFSTWLFAIAHQQNALFFRRKAKLPTVQFFSQNAELEVQVTGTEDGALQEMERQEEVRDLWKTIRTHLSAEKAEILWLFYVEEKPQFEIARIMDRTAAGVKTLLFRARNELEDILKVGQE